MINYSTLRLLYLPGQAQGTGSSRMSTTSIPLYRRFVTAPAVLKSNNPILQEPWYTKYAVLCSSYWICSLTTTHSTWLPIYLRTYCVTYLTRGISCYCSLWTSFDSIDRLLGEFEQTLRKWRDWDDITVMENHQLIRDYVMDLWRHGLQVGPSLISYRSSMDWQF